MSWRRIPPPAHDGSGAARAGVDGCGRGVGYAVGFMRRVRPPGVRSPGVLRAVLGGGTALGRRADLQHPLLRACTRSVGKSSVPKGSRQLARHLRCSRASRPRSDGGPLRAGIDVDRRGPRWPTRIEMGQGFINDSSRLHKNGPPLSCFRIILLSNLSAGRSFASVPEVEPPSAALQMQRSSVRPDGCARSAAEDPPRRCRCRGSGHATISRCARSASASAVSLVVDGSSRAEGERTASNLQ